MQDAPSPLVCHECGGPAVEVWPSECQHPCCKVHVRAAWLDSGNEHVSACDQCFFPRYVQAYVQAYISHQSRGGRLFHWEFFGDEACDAPARLAAALVADLRDRQKWVAAGGGGVWRGELVLEAFPRVFEEIVPEGSAVRVVMPGRLRLPPGDKMQIRMTAGAKFMQLSSLAAIFASQKNDVPDGPLVEFVGDAFASEEVSSWLV